ncbi:Coatomer subunit gamma-2 [Amphibalanus amphitrite]|uniref:Coatomer subunit gamma n=1 Tax=Amphibalanus amphitrite TaxID=1232801 RepID=A0A6A4X0F4_AMPAM|nr:Coatomer subunit gamma-2 [Amphibalanus amphitrite]
MMDKKNEEDGSGNPFSNLEKTSVLQEARTFNETPVNPRKCIHILSKILYMLNQGEQLGSTEATEAFFAMTKLFQSKDVTLRRLVYLGIKELAGVADDVIIVTSSLTKDMTGKEDLYRAAAIRALCCITDTTMLQAIERYMKQAIVDRSVEASAAPQLVSALHLMRSSPDVVKRWSNEAQEALNSDNVMVQYHALGLLYNIKKSDRLAVTKLVAKLTRSAPRSPYAVCMLIRTACKLMEEEDAGTESPLFDFVDSCLRHKSEMVVYEAAHAIVNMPRTSPRELAPAVSVLQLFLSSPKPTLRFAAVRTLNQVAMTHPAVVTACNLDLESLISDVNRSIATLAITTLLKTGAESSVDRLMKQISSFVNEISDEFKIVVVQAIKALCLKFPRKHGVLMNFLSSMLRDEGGLEYKASIADTIITIIEENPEAKEAGLSHLCEFIEDCEHTSLAVRILHLLGREGPKTKQPSKYIRFIYNRVILESAARCQMDSDDEVRDRATYYYNILDQQQAALNNQYILNSLQVSLVGLEKALQAYSQGPADQPFDLRSVPVAEAAPTDSRAAAPEGSIASSRKPEEKVTATRQDVFAEQLSKIPEFQQLGPLFKSSQPVELTESETEYVVQCIKHVFAHHVVLQFDCKNTLNDQLLEDVTVQLEAADGFEVVATLPCARLEYNVTNTCYTLIKLPDDLMATVGSCGATLRYVVKDCDPATGLPDTDEGYEDEYLLEEVELTVADHVQRVLKANFGAAWDEIGDQNELEDTYALSAMKTLEQAVKQISQFMGMQACERSDKVPDGKSSHTLLLSGVYRGGAEVLVRARLALSDGVTMQLTVRSTDPAVSEVIASAVG